MDEHPSLTRKTEPMSDAVAQALKDRDLQSAYAARPPYQRNDYLGWINRAVRSETKAKRLAQMLDELEAGDTYMGMDWRGGRSQKRR